MGAQVVDYRVSTLVVLCKDCGHDVGLYPARHKCQPVERPAMPALPAQYTKEKRLNIPGSLELSTRTISSGSTSSMASSPSPSFSSAETPTSKWSSRMNRTENNDEESVYFNNFASNLTDEPSGKKLWGKVRQNEKWKQLSEKNEKPANKPSGKLWGKLIQATQNMADKIPSRDDRGAESDEDDWEGETHVSRILREYYEKKRLRLPEWLFDDNVAVQRKPSVSGQGRADNNLLASARPEGPIRTPSRRRLWEQNPGDANKVSSRERERQELRQAAQSPAEPESRGRYSHRDHSEHSRNSIDHYSNREHHQEDHSFHKSNERNRYSHENRYRDNRGEDRYNVRDSYDTPPSRRGSRDQPHYYNDDRYAPQSSQRPLSPPRLQQRSNSTSRSRYYDEHNDGYDYHKNYPAVRSERSTRGYNESVTRPNRYEQSPGSEDYYHNRHGDPRRAVPPSSQSREHARYNQPPAMDRRDPSIHNGGRRYGNDPSYF